MVVLRGCAQGPGAACPAGPVCACSRRHGLVPTGAGPQCARYQRRRPGRERADGSVTVPFSTEGTSPPQRRPADTERRASVAQTGLVHRLALRVALATARHTKSLEVCLGAANAKVP
jgi:hypothetical protein